MSPAPPRPEKPKRSFADLLLGRPLSNREEHDQKVGVFAGLPLLGLDGLGSAAYGPEAAMTILIVLGAGGTQVAMPIFGAILAILFVLYFSYRQTIAAYPGGGGSYAVSRRNLGTIPGLLAAAALMIDYVLVVAVGISAGVGALISAAPVLLPYRLEICLFLLALVAVVNLRGVRESGLAFAIPTYIFVVGLFGVLGWGIVQVVASGGHPVPIDPPPTPEPALGVATLWLLLRSFASGCTAMTGVEAVSNGVPVFAAPTVKNAQRTLTAIVMILAILLAGIAFLAKAYGIAATDPEGAGYESILSQLIGAIAGKGAIYYIVITAVLAVLALSANTGFADFPRICRLLAEDDYMPHAFANRGRRLVYTWGISILTTLSTIILIAFNGVTDRLIALFAVGAFLAFTLSQAGMVMHWLRLKTPGWKASMVINALGALSTGIALLVVLVAKFADGAWLTVLMIPGFVSVFLLIRRHYLHVRRDTRLHQPMAVGSMEPPIMIVPIKTVNAVAAKGIDLAMSLSPKVVVVHIAAEHGHNQAFIEAWRSKICHPLESADRPSPVLFIVPSPYRRLFHPLIEVVEQFLIDNPTCRVCVLVPDLVEAKWYQYLLHNQRAAALKAALLLQGGSRVSVLSVPWYFESPGAPRP
jgi:amino acid transporter